MAKIHRHLKYDKFLASFLLQKKKIKVNWKIWFIIDDVSSIGSGWNMSKCFQSCFASYCWWCLQRLCIYEFSFLCRCSWLQHWNGTLQNAVLQGCWMCGAAQFCLTVRGESTHLPPHPLLSRKHTPSPLRRATGWIAASLHRKGERHGGKGMRITIQHQKVSSEPNELQGGQAQHVLSKEGLCDIPDKILAVW